MVEQGRWLTWSGSSSDRARRWTVLVWAGAGR